MIRNSVVSSFVSSVTLLTLVASASARENPELVAKIDQRFRSSSRYIPAEVLMSEAVPAIGPTLLHDLADMSEGDLLASLASAEKAKTLEVNQGVAENLLKLQRIAQLSRDLRPYADEHGDAVNGLAQPELDKLVSHFSEVDAKTTIQAREFDLPMYEIRRLAFREVLNNDHYNFKVAADMFVQGKHKTHRASFSLFSRGKGNRPFIVAVGQDQVLDLVENLHFTEREIQALKNHPDYAHVPAEFFDYLRTFKFKGTIRGVPVGTPVFANETILEVTGDPIETQIVETLIIPIVNAMSNFATKTARVVHWADGRPVAEGGTRRGAAGLLSALASYIAGASGTSNMQIVRLFGMKAYGSMPHARVLNDDSEIDSFIKYGELFPTTLLLGDTFDILEGTKTALRARGKKLAGLRIDSTIPGMDIAQTTTAVRGILDELGYQNVPIVYSNDLNEYQFAKLPQSKAPFQFAQVGTEIASPSDSNGLGMVYKLEELVDLRTGQVFDPMKFSTGKTSIPGQKQLVRYEKDGKYDRDTIAVRGEPVRGNGTLLTIDMMVDGVRVIPRESVHAQRASTMAMLAKLPTRLFALEGEVEPYPVRLSSQLKARQDAAVAKLKPAKKRRVGVYFGSFDPVTEAHKNLALGMKTLYSMDQVLIEPTGDHPVLSEKKSYLFSVPQRVSMLRKTFEGHNDVSVDTSQAEGRTKYAFETLAEIAASQPEGTEIYVLGGEDLLKSLPSWKNADELVAKYNWVISRRNGSGKIELPAPLLQGHRMRSSSHAVSASGKVIELVDLPKVPSQLSSTLERGLYDGVEAIFHQVDAQKTFWKDNHGEGDGPLAVGGTPEITANVAALAALGHRSNRIKSVSSKDNHVMNEVTNAEIDTDFHFHPTPDGKWTGFPQHGMAGVDGPVGDSRIPEVRVYAQDKKLVIPHHEQHGSGLRLVPFDLDAVSNQILDPRFEIVILKNGPNSTNVFQNPRTKKVYKRINPTKGKKVFVYGVATDFCVLDAVMGLLAEGYEVYLVVDAIAGVFEEKTKAELAKMQAAGAKFITTAEVLEHFADEAPSCPGVFASIR